MAANSKIICVLGMHRSGTSLLTGWLQCCGLNVGDDLLNSDFSNQAGHFEDLDFLSLHKDILRSNAFESTGLQPTEGNFQLSQYHLAKMEHLIDLKNKLYEEWAWKDPRTCLFVDSYLQKIPDLKFLIIHRPATEVIQSLLKRDWDRWKRQMESMTLGRLHPKLLFKNSFKREFIESRLPKYVRVCELYFEKIIWTIKNTSEHNRLAFTLSFFRQYDREVFNEIKHKWNLNLNYSSIETIYKQELMGASEFNVVVSDRLATLDSQLNQLVRK